MHDGVQKPMTDHETTHNERILAIPTKKKVKPGNQNRPSQHRQQAVGNGVMLKHQRCDMGRLRSDANALDTKQQERWPQQIKKLSGEKQCSQGHTRGNGFCAETKTEVTDKHKNGWLKDERDCLVPRDTCTCGGQQPNATMGTKRFHQLTRFLKG